jgi:exopolyphosphatase / guanosine-5'-triphosphate,3'-diphosphate pyrophosphatase
MKDRLGIIDLGTNTFHLLIVEKNDHRTEVLFHVSRAARIGEGGINHQVITEAATSRALEVLRYFREQLDQHGIEPQKAFAFGTSAIRNAQNREEFCATIWQETGIDIRVIDGNQEAGYIYQGVKKALDLGEEPSMIVDIGGGSVEFIIGNRSQVFWQQSFEIGGQRLMEKFMRTDPLSGTDRKRLYDYFDERLIPLANAVHQYAPTTLIGSSGSFDTLVDMDYHHRTGVGPESGQTGFDLPLEEFYRSYEALLTLNHDERLAIPGMIPLRVNMIVVAICLIEYLLRTHGIKKIRVSSYALKEGVLAGFL